MTQHLGDASDARLKKEGRLEQTYTEFDCKKVGDRLLCPRPPPAIGYRSHASLTESSFVDIKDRWRDWMGHVVTQNVYCMNDM